MKKRAPFEFEGVKIAPGEHVVVPLPLPGLYADIEVTMPVHVIHGRREGGVAFVSAAVHGDEINGVEIIRRLASLPSLQHMRGTLLLVPVVNLYGFQDKSRYLPDRRDLNRSFPGSESGSLASRLADTFMNKVVAHCDFGIDLHTAAIHRENMPQIRADVNDPQLAQLARSFAAPALIHSAPPEGSLRRAGAERAIPIMVYEAGEALRFDETSIRIGLKGILNVLQTTGMIKSRHKPPKPSPLLRSTRWIRAPRSGVFRSLRPLGALVEKGDLLGLINDPSGRDETQVRAAFAGVIIGRAQLPLVYEGEALFHIGRSAQPELLAEHLDTLNDTHALTPAELVEEPEIV